MATKWQQFLAENQIVVDKEFGRDLRSELDLSEFEIRANIVLPEDYKSLCQFLGSGAFSKTPESHCNLRIRCPDAEYSKEVIDSLSSSLAYEIESGNAINTEKHEALLNSAFLFADNSKAHIFIWDLRTYDLSNKNYDVYLISTHDSPLKAYLIAHDFFDFVLDFGLGKKSYKFLPKRLQPKQLHPCIFASIPRSF